MMRHLALAHTLSLAIWLATFDHSDARSFDMRTCPLDAVTFTDPWAGESFEVAKVGTNYQYDCPSGMKPSPPANEECRGPYGDLILEGTYTRDTEKQTAYAIYTTIPGVPCCGWSTTNKKEDLVRATQKNFHWFSSKDMPQLGKYPFASINPEEAAPDWEIKQFFSNPLIALKCR